jgi:histidine triad (HIT) family protein
MNCLFCKIISGEISTYKVYEDEDVLAFLDIEPLTKGHTVIVPKAHVENLLDLDDEKVKKLFLVVKKIAQNLKDKLSLEGMNIGINMGEVAGQAMNHLHIHILPRYEGDGGGSVHSIVNNSPTETLDEVLSIVKM